MNRVLERRGEFKDTLEEVANYIFTSKYARYNKDAGRRENWDEAVGRVEAMHLRKFDNLPSDVTDEIRWAFDMVRDKRSLPSMRAMQFGGPAVEAHNARIYNCLGVETRFITSSGVKSFEDFEDGDVIKVLGHSGKWRSAVVRNYGIGTLIPHYVSKGKNSSVVWATEDHRWMQRGGEITEGVKEGDQLHGSQDIFSEFDWDGASWDEKIYWCYGLVYGDGTRLKDRGGNYVGSMIRLCGADKKFAARFEEVGFKTSSSQSLDGDFMAYTGSYLKTAPDPSIDAPNLIRAFVRGYLDADGEKSDGRSDNKFLTIQSSEEDHIEFIRNVFPVAGVYIVSESDLTGQETNYGLRPYTVKFRVTNFIKNGGAYIPGSMFRVDVIGDATRVEDVWCLEVEEDQTFVLANGLVTGNCAVRHIDSLRAFSEAFYLLLCGCGVGFGLTHKYLDRLPDLVSAEDKTGIVMTYVVEDNIEGWADSVEALLMCYFKDTPFSGRKIVFDYSRIREKGAELKTGGGKAPGHEGLKAAHIKIKELLDRIIEVGSQTRLYSIDAYDILMHQSDAVLSGGVRRSACAALFDKDDELMLNAKTGNWFEENPQRGRSNNSAILLRDRVTREEFSAVMERTKEWGEPGFVFAETEDVLYNPCFEVSFVPVTEDGVCGVQFCNLTTVNGAKVKTEEDFYEAVRAAAIIGTLQASYTDFKYLSNTAKKLTEAEALLGVSITGMMENPDILLDARVQRIGARIVKQVNAWLAPILGINPSPRSCVIKPEGSSSLAVGSMCSGIHAAHDRVMWRRVQANTQDNAYQHFKWYNPHLCEPSKWSSNGTDDIISFPIVLDDKVMLKKDLTALKHLDIIKSTQKNWVIEGTASFNTKPIHHNVSCTVAVRDDEWGGVTDYLYDNRNSFAAVSLVGASSDKDYVQAPNESVITTDEEELFLNQMRGLATVNWSLMVEDTDNTSLMQELSCAGPEGCEVK